MTRWYLLATFLVFIIGNQPLAAQETDERIPQLLKQLESDQFAIRDEAQKGLVKIGAAAAKPLLETWLDPDAPLDHKSACPAIFGRWLELEDDEALAGLFDALAQADLGGDSPEMTAARKMLTDRISINAIKRILGGNNALDFRSGFFGSIREWEFSDRESRLIGLLPDLKVLACPLDLPIAFFQNQTNSSIEHLTLQSSSMELVEFDADVMGAILAMKNLNNLELGNAKLGIEAVQLLAKSDKIKTLDYLITRQQDFAVIAEMPNLESFTIRGDFNGEPIVIDAEQFRPMTKLNLKNLTLGPGKLDPGVSRLIGEFPNLTTIRLNYPDLQSLKALLGHKQIVHVELYAHPTIVDFCARELAEANHLKTLTLEMSSVTDVGIESLAKMKFLDRLSFSSGMISKKGKKKIETDLKGIVETGFGSDDTLSEEDSQTVHEMAQKGLYTHSFPNQPQFFVFKKNWTGTEEDFIKIINMKGWKSLQTDLPLNPPVIDAMIASQAEKRHCIIYDSGQHPDGAMERIHQSFEFKPFGDFPRQMMPESGDGEAFILKKPEK